MNTENSKSENSNLSLVEQIIIWGGMFTGCALWVVIALYAISKG
jgi:hypothetical protein